MDITQLSASPVVSQAQTASGGFLRSAAGEKPVTPEVAAKAQAVQAEQATRESDAQTAVESDELQVAADSLNTSLFGAGTSLKFKIDQDLNRVVVSIVDADSGDVIRQIPPEELLRLARLAKEGGGSVSLLDEFA
ncbi:MAG: flagellar protein FlaG [Gammaproteobacteria bacterium]|nr:flagellar protein FlaG [Gammaproteobacteria bacterium]